MSKKSKRRAAAKEAERIERMKRMASKKKAPIKINKKKVIIAAAISLVLIAAIVVGIVVSVLSNRDFNYMTGDISRYIKLSEKDYKNYTLEIDFDEVSESDVERKIMNLLYKNRSEKPMDNGENKISIPISVGDEAYIYYRGYTVDENGKETAIANTSNLLSGEVYKLEIGSLGFIPGFEEGLIGAIPEQHQFELIKSGEVQTGDVIYLSYTVTYPDGSSDQKKNERIDLSKADIDEKYGTGFKAYFTGAESNSGKPIGSKLEGATFGMDTGSAVYFDMTVNYVTRCEDNAYTVDAHFPANYHEKLLRGVDVKFDVFIDYTVVYNVPEYNEEFITETLKITAEDLSEYEGEGIVEKHRAKLLSEAKEENEASRKSLIEEGVWNHYRSKAKIKKLPKKEVERAYVERMYELQYLASQYGYQDLGKFVLAYYQLGQNADWEAVIMAEVKNVIAEKLIFYYIIRRENLIPTSLEYQELYEAKTEELLTEYIEVNGYKSELEKIEDEAKKSERTEEIRNEMLSVYGNDYLKEMIYYEYGYDKILAFANVVEK